MQKTIESPFGTVNRARQGSWRAQLDVRTVESKDALELFITAIPQAHRDSPTEANEMFAAIAEAVKAHDARIVRQRIFVPSGRVDSYREACKAAFAEYELPIPTTWLWAGGPSALGGVQMYAVRGCSDWQPLTTDDACVGWTFRQGQHRWAITRNVPQDTSGDGPAQAKSAFAIGEKVLAQAGMELRDVARTWIFMEDILGWYGGLNAVRNSLFIERGLLRKGQKPGEAEVPASTGIGVFPIGSKVGIEFLAIDGPAGCLQRLAAAGKQRAAYEYGSAFARASEIPTPGGRSIYVSGTAAIDEAGATCHLDDIKAQVDMTMRCILAVLNTCKADPLKAVQAMAYCKTPEVEHYFREAWLREMNWPWITCIADVCRDDLLFEAEVTVCESTDAK